MCAITSCRSKPGTPRGSRSQSVAFNMSLEPQRTRPYPGLPAVRSLDAISSARAGLEARLRALADDEHLRAVPEERDPSGRGERDLEREAARERCDSAERRRDLAVRAPGHEAEAGRVLRELGGRVGAGRAESAQDVRGSERLARPVRRDEDVR